MRKIIIGSKVRNYNLGEITSISTRRLENEVTGMKLTRIQSGLKNDPNREINPNQFFDLYSALIVKYKNELEQNNLLNEFKSIFRELMIDNAEDLIPPRALGTFRGDFLLDLMSMFPEDFFLTRGFLSKIIFGDRHYLMKSFFGRRLHTIPDILTLQNIEKNLLGLSLSDIDSYLGSPFTQGDLNYIQHNIAQKMKTYKKVSAYNQESKREAFCRYMAEYIFGGTFERVRPAWLTGVKGYPIELDGYNEELGIAFEHNGPHHYDYEFFMDLYDLSESEAIERYETFRANDKIKREICNERRITLITIPYYIKYGEIQSFIMEQYRALTSEDAPSKPLLDHERVLETIISRRVEQVTEAELKDIDYFD